LVNFAYIFASSICLFISFCRKIQTQIVGTEKLRKTLAHKKAAHIRLMKLIPGLCVHHLRKLRLRLRKFEANENRLKLFSLFCVPKFLNCSSRPQNEIFQLHRYSFTNNIKMGRVYGRPQGRARGALAHLMGQNSKNSMFFDFFGKLYLLLDAFRQLFLTFTHGPRPPPLKFRCLNSC